MQKKYGEVIVISMLKITIQQHEFFLPFFLIMKIIWFILITDVRTYTYPSVLIPEFDLFEDQLRYSIYIRTVSS